MIASIDIGLDIIILLFLIITALAVIKVRNLLTSTILLSIFSLLMAAQYLVLGAPDVAITEAAVGAGISTILLLLALFYIGDKEKRCSSNFTISAIVVFIVTALLMYVTFDMPAYGDPAAPANAGVAEYYLTQSKEQIGIPNVVASILASYRGYDTFGETTVIFTASAAVLLLIGSFRKEKKK